MKRIMLCLVVVGLLMTIPAVTYAQGEPGNVYAMTNAAINEIVVYHRSADGMLTLAGIVPTGGAGETTEPGDALGGSNPLILSADNRWLFAVNAGSDTISVFRVDSDALTFLQQIDSHGDLPVSLTTHKNLIYVLNARGGGKIAGFTIDNKSGHLTFLDGSVRSLNASTASEPFFLNSPAQVGFNPLGDKLVVTAKEATSGEGAKIQVFAVDGNGLPSATPVINSSPVPFGFVFDDLNNLIVAEPFGASSPAGKQGAASSYRIAADGTLVLISGSVANEQTATCWIAITTSTRFAYTTNNGGDGDNPGGTISSYRVASDGSLSVINDIAARTGDAPVDLAITPNSRFLYEVNAGDGTVGMFRIDPANGNLIALGAIGGLPDDDSASAVGIAAR